MHSLKEITFASFMHAASFFCKSSIFFFISSHLIKNHLSPCLFKGFFFFRFSHSNDFIHFFFNFLFDSNTCLPQFLKETLTSLFPFCSLLFSPLLFSLRWRWTSPNKFTFFLSCSSSSSMIPICTFCNLSFNFSESLQSFSSNQLKNFAAQ